MKGTLVIDGNAVYELDVESMQKQRERAWKEAQALGREREENRKKEKRGK